MTTLEQRITNFEEQAQQLLDLPQDIAGAAMEQIGRVGSAYQGHLNSLSVTARVNQLTGSDDAQGVEGDPYKTIERALEDTPRGGICFCSVEGDYHMDKRLEIDGFRLILDQVDSERRNLTFDRDQLGTNTVFRRLTGFNLSNGGFIHVSGWTIVMPPLDGNWGAYPEFTQSSVFFTSANIASGLTGISVSFCDLEFPSQPFGALMNGTAPMAVYFASVTASDQPINGNLIRNVTDSAGTDTNTLPYLLTNLDLV